jgi:CubicO group peptidase (beta-lactamase class C family)
MLRRAVLAGRFPGCVAMWGRGDGPARVAAVGDASVYPVRFPADTGIWYDLASLTKPLVVGTLCLLAFRRGALRLGDEVGESLPEASPSPIASISVARLLGHASGLPAWLPLYGLGVDPGSARAAVLELEPGCDPGGGVEYSCVGYIILGWILEGVFGCRLDEAFRREVLRPLGIEAELGFRPDPHRIRLAGSALDGEAERRLAAEMGFEPRGFTAPAPGRPEDGNARFLGGVSGNAGLFGTARGVFELARQYLSSSSRLLTDDEIEIAGGELAAAGGQRRAVGWQLATSTGCSAGAALSREAFGHTGHTGTSLWVDPVRGLVLLLLANRNHPHFRDVDLHPLRRRFHTLAVDDLGARS